MRQEGGDGSSNSSSNSSGRIDDSNDECQSSENGTMPNHPNHNAQHDTEYSAQTLAWATKIPIGLGLCPWAVKSHSKGLLRIVIYKGSTLNDATKMLQSEIKALTREGVPPLSTTLMVCPHVKAWQEFGSFDEFVRTGFKQQSLLQHQKNDTSVKTTKDVTLVAFHPSFLRWHGLPEGVGVGSVVQSHWGMIGQKSLQTDTATIIETNNQAFGMRKVKVRFHDSALEGLGRQEQFVPTDWITSLNDVDRMPLPDNMMHRSPHPTIHIIVNQDLASTCIRDVSRVKRLNATRMSKLGWEGVQRRLGSDG